MAIEHFDVLVVGAGISGIGAGWHLSNKCPDRSYAILEGRADIGGTWDLFRYPGIRSDSDMYTLGFAHRPWTEAKAIADGPSILNYLNEAADEYGIRPHIRFGHRVKSAVWSTDDARWTVEGENGGKPFALTCNFLFMCSGYYDYAAGYSPGFTGSADFAGQIVHPQHWPKNLNYAGKRVVVIGSGATAVTIVPEIAKDAAHVTMLQRSPSYVVSRPAVDAIADWLREHLPAKLAYSLVRMKNVGLGALFFRLARRKPAKVKERLLGMVRNELGPDYDIATHFNPRYNPWDQRLCLVPDGDLFRSLREGKASVVTDTIERFDETGIALASGKHLDADIIVTATGLQLQLMGGIALTVDGVATDPSQSLQYKGMMFSGIPNIATSFGYTNASWTLKADLTCGYVCRLLNTMRRRGLRQCTPVAAGPVETAPFLDFSSGYVTRAIDRFPKQGVKNPWRVHQNYALDLMALKFGKVDDGTMVFSNPERAKVRKAA